VCIKNNKEPPFTRIGVGIWQSRIGQVVGLEKGNNIMQRRVKRLFFHDLLAFLKANSQTVSDNRGRTSIHPSTHPYLSVFVLPAPFLVCSPKPTTYPTTYTHPSIDPQTSPSVRPSSFAAVHKQPIDLRTCRTLNIRTHDWTLQESGLLNARLPRVKLLVSRVLAPHALHSSDRKKLPR